MSITNNILNLDVKSKEGISDKKKNVIKNTVLKQNNFIPEEQDFSSEIKMPLFFQSLDKIINLNEKTLFSKSIIFYSFNNVKMAKYLQKCLINASKEKITFIIEELKGSFREVIKNKNGNYFCSNLIKICDKNNRIKILKELSKTINEDCIDEFGTYPIQNLIQFASSEDEFQLLLSSFNNYEAILIPAINPHGTFVIQKIIKHIPENLRIEFNSIFVKFVSFLAKDKYGAFCLEKFILYTKNERILNQILKSIVDDFINLSTNKIGNYLIQNLLLKWWDNEKGENIKKIIKAKYSILNNNIYSNHICQLYNKLNNNENNSASSFNTYNII